ncbi:hypothetical protein DICVIV_09104 [Dictyocaulus viviparus]|uniref:Winged helix Storkhead-box1 domain-containing protein n=1 Tax=Dictyocaulus viviparus TaxID=29172 RepID=A0A0D8XM32_DICVI|nr:hypothetical protein DICVIV_09104 [Dictyocaulus viviparus]
MLLSNVGTLRQIKRQEMMEIQSFGYEIRYKEVMSCLAITFNGPKAKNGRRLFENFVQANKYSFWNRELVQAVESLIFMGFMRPCTIFISGPVIHLQSLRTAWARRVLKPADGYLISSLGEMGAIQMVEQMHFVPLADVLCDAIVSLTRLGRGSTLAAVRQYVIRNCPYVAPPSIEMVKQTVATLVATGLVYRMGDHLFVSVPAQTTEQAKVEVECQTGMSIIALAEPEKKDRLGFLARIFTKRQPASAPQSTCFPKVVPEWNRKPLATTTCRYSNQISQHFIDREPRHYPKCEQNHIISTSKCLNYGPIDPPECLPGKIEVVKTSRSRRKRRIKRMEIRTSTPVDGSDSAYSPSPVTDSNEEPGCWSEPESAKVHHTYMNIATHDSTNFEEMPTIICPSRLAHFSNL